MVDTALQNRLDGIVLLLTMAVSLLSGLTFGRSYPDRVAVAETSFVALVGSLLVVSYVQPTPGDAEA